MLYDCVQRKLMAPAGRGPGVPRPRRRLGLRQEPLHRAAVDHRRAARAPTTPAADERGASSSRWSPPASPPHPDYFVYDAVLNRKRPPAVFDPATAPRPLSTDRVRRAAHAGAVVVDARDPQEFAAGHLRGSLNVPADGRFAETAGTVVTARPADRRGRPAGPRGGDRHPARPHRLRPRRRLSARTRGRVPRRARSRSPAPAG